jgi:UDP-glucose:(heptosyl)LPS alpha-1,3-glucosyltransferase
MVQKEIISEFGYPSDRITVIYNGLPATHFDRSPQIRVKTRHEWDIEEEEVALLFAGSGWDRKGLRYAIRAVERVSNRNVCLFVAGTEQKPAYNSSKARFLGPVTDMQSLFAATDLFVLPTVYDPFSNACLEALSYGMPVITTASNGFAEIITSGVHGEVINRADDIAALHQAIEKWIDRDRRESAREKCAQLACSYTMERNVDQTVSVLEKLSGS